MLIATHSGLRGRPGTELTDELIDETIGRLAGDRCEGLGMCEAMTHEFFELDDDDMMTVLDQSPAETERSTVHAAAEACPVQALCLIG